MNPYDFVRVDWSRPPGRHQGLTAERFSGLSGRIEATLTAEMPLFLPARLDSGQPRTEPSGAVIFCQSDAYRPEGRRSPGYFIPGSSLKGMLRSVVETIAQGCFWFCRELENVAQLQDFQKCEQANALCPACRIFGMLNRGILRRGNVCISDAVCVQAVDYAPIYTVILSNPKPQHHAFYYDGNLIAGRKFYFHHRPDNLLTANGWLPANAAPLQRQNQYIHPLGPGSRFEFSVDFENVEAQDLEALFFALCLEPDMRHKLGYAKPCGLGSVRIELTRLTLYDLTARYRRGGGVQVYEDTALNTEVARRTAPCIAAIPAITLDDLRRIWQWPPHGGVTYRYPTRAWFDDHPHDLLSQTP